MPVELDHGCVEPLAFGRNVLQFANATPVFCRYPAEF